MDMDGGGEDCAELVLHPSGHMRTPGYWNLHKNWHWVGQYQNCIPHLINFI